jgi:NADH-quinone oxidoreductase subunit H
MNVLIYAIWAVVLLVVVLLSVCYEIYFERKFIGWMQFRKGPTKTGPLGLFQSFADVLKLLLKEDSIPFRADKWMFILAPGIAFVPSFVILAVIPYSAELHFTNLNIGALYFGAITGITTIGVVLGGWASNNKYSLIGGMRSAAQMISYEVPIVLSVGGVIMLTGSMNLNEIGAAQGNWFWEWNFIPNIIGFVVFVIASVSELNRSPFDLPEAENELVAGYHVEYTGFRFAFFMLAEYVYMYGMGAFVTLIYLGGWQAPAPFLEFIPGVVWFILKWILYIFFLYWLRATMPRVRIDQLMNFGWKVLLPLAVLNIFVTAILMLTGIITQ